MIIKLSKGARGELMAQVEDQTVFVAKSFPELLNYLFGWIHRWSCGG